MGGPPQRSRRRSVRRLWSKGGRWNPRRCGCVRARTAAASSISRFRKAATASSAAGARRWVSRWTASHVFRTGRCGWVISPPAGTARSRRPRSARSTARSTSTRPRTELPEELMADGTLAAETVDVALLQRVVKEVSRRIVGQDMMVERLLVGMLTGGHILLEDVPGLAKTLAVRTLSEIIHASFSRIQFTPDLLPADVIGTMVFDQKSQDFYVKKGPLFAHIILADEINRAPAKVQAALLEAMQEKQVTIGGTTFTLDEPFLVLATQNPNEQEGTDPLPEAQVDRFIMKVVVGYPSRSEEQLIIRQNVQGIPSATVNPVVSVQEIISARQMVRDIYMDEKVEQYILDI